jgi:uncharacterized protein YdaU (DUF1376 family)
MAIWSSRSVALPTEPRKFARAAGVSLRLWNSRVWPALEQYFSTCEDGLTQKRLREEAAYVERQVTNQSTRKRSENSDKILKNNKPTETVDKITDIPTDHPTQQPNNLHIGSGGDARARDPEHPPDKTERENLLETMGADPISGLTGPNGLQIGRLAVMQAFRAWQNDLGLSFEEIVAVIREVMAKKPDGLGRTQTDARDRFGAISGFEEVPIEKMRPPSHPDVVAFIMPQIVRFVQAAKPGNSLLYYSGELATDSAKTRDVKDRAR